MRYEGHRTYDKALLHNLNLFEDYSVFGTIRFFVQLSKFQMNGVFIQLIRSLEIRNKGQWVVKFEGFNQGTHNLHFLLREGFKEEDTHNLIRDLYRSFAVLNATGMATAEFTRYDASKGASWYMAKQIESDKILNPFAEDIDQGNYFQVSTELAKAITEANERDRQFVTDCKKGRLREDIRNFNEPLF